MGKYPHAPQPHNLYGVVLEYQNKHSEAMKHFRAAQALDPNYRPAKYNLSNYGNSFFKRHCALDESDCMNYSSIVHEASNLPNYSKLLHIKNEISETMR